MYLSCGLTVFKMCQLTKKAMDEFQRHNIVWNGSCWLEQRLSTSPQGKDFLKK